MEDKAEFVFIGTNELDDTKVKFRGEIVSLTRSALTIIQEMGYDWDRISGPTYWSLNGETLSEIRRKNEM